MTEQGQTTGRATDWADAGASLQELVLQSADVDEFLGWLARHAADSLSGDGLVVHCGVTLLRDKDMATVASSGPKALELDETQYKYGDGPCLRAARTNHLTHVLDTETETEWAGYLAEVRQSGIRSILGVPVALDDGNGGLNLYATEPSAFDGEMMARAIAYAEQASTSLRLAVRMGRLAQGRDDLRAALESRTVIDLAVGIVIAQNKCTQAEAFGILRDASSHRNIKLRDLAAQLVEGITGQPATTHWE